MSADFPERALPVAEELAGIFTRMSGLLLAQETIDTALDTIATLALATLPDTLGAAVTLVDKQGHKTSAGATSELIERADALQYELDEGPCLTAWAQRTLVRVDDVAHDQRWPRWGCAVQPLGVRSTLSTPLFAGDTALGAIKVYGQGPDAYDRHAEQVLTLFASLAAILVANGQAVDNARRLSDELKAPLHSRDVISTAKGVLVAQDGIDEEAALGRLVAISQRDGRRLRDVAETVVRTATHTGAIWPAMSIRAGTAEQQRRALEIAFGRADLTIEDLWMRYFALGGDVGAVELEAYLRGLMPLAGAQRDILAHAVNERLDDLITRLRVPYSRTLHDAAPVKRAARRAGESAREV